MTEHRDAPRTGQDPAPEQGSAFPGVADGMERLWTPHRWAYVEADHPRESSGSDECPFCAAPDRSDEDALIVHRGETCYVLLNLFPYNPGHLLVCSYRHVARYTDLTAQERAEFGEVTAQAMHALQRASGPHGINIGMNQGEVAGAGIASHLHQHLVPRWKGDANFFPIIAQTKALPVVLSDTRTLIADAWDA